MNEQLIHDAATIILLRKTSGGPAVLMGKRSAEAVFMPNKFVFPGGRVDAGDQFDVGQLSSPNIEALKAHANEGLAGKIVAAGLRE